ncbi:MAG: SDR family oxidoreductase [Deltaproteobacteria bacterium]|nr:SDR family oxidoreductase [Deltaproteobacteria bacterium]
MRIIILGGTGMLGHQLWKYLPSCFPDTFVTIRYGRGDYGNSNLYQSERVIENMDVSDLNRVTGVLKAIQPNVILNCIALTPRREKTDNPIPSIFLNALFPHQLAKLAGDIRARLIHFSTDCVFDGVAGHYKDNSLTNATDLYGRTKALGEIKANHVLTLRSSFIGRELKGGTELLEWFLAQKGEVRGFKNAIYTGFTTLEISRVIERLLQSYPDAAGLYNVSSDPINKYDLLKLIAKKMRPGIKVLPEKQFRCDRSLDSTRFRKEFDYNPPNWGNMVEELSQE